MSNCLLRVIPVFLIVAVLAVAPCSNAEQSTQPDIAVTLLVFNRPPYYLIENDRPAGGFLLDIALAVFHQAGIAVKTKEMPPSRILSLLQGRDELVCSVGWFATPERLAFARFSDSLYRNGSIGVVVNAERRQAADAPVSLNSLLQQRATLGLREGFSYGEAIDRQLREHPGGAVRRFAETRQMLQLVALNRLDAVLIGPEEVAWEQQSNPDLEKSLRFLPLADAPSGLDRRIMCHKAVPQAIMDRIDAAIAAFGTTDAYRRLAGQGRPHERAHRVR